ncbi:MAG: hypothetical protein ACREMA_00710 [Longimicrobiales bacterium]
MTKRFANRRLLHIGSAILLLSACDLGLGVETRDRASQFPLRANWNATAAPVGTGTVRATVTIKEYLGQRLDATAALTGGAPTTAYQWRIFRGDCATTAVAANNTAPTGLLLFATIQSYPDLTTNAAGTVTLPRVIAGALDSLTAYSVRIRVAQSATNWNGTSPIACGNMTRS